MSRPDTTASEMPGPGQGRPLGGQLDDLDTLFDFQPVFDRAVSRVTSPESHTRTALHELVCIVATRLHVERSVLGALAAMFPADVDHRTGHTSAHHRIEVLLSWIDRRAASDPQLAEVFGELQDLVRSHNAHQVLVFSSVRTALSAEQVDQLRIDLASAVDAAMTRPHPHLPHHGPLGRWSGALAARADRLRNRGTVR